MRFWKPILSLARLVIIIMTITIISCTEDEPTLEDRFNEETQNIADYITENDLDDLVSIDEDFNLRYIINDPGSGLAPLSDDLVDITYSVTLLDTEVTAVEETRTTGFVYNLIPGVSILLPKVMEGGDITMFIPSLYGFGDITFDNIPANSTLIVDVLLHEVNQRSELEQFAFEQAVIVDYLTENEIEASVDEESGMYYVINEEGTGDNPTANSDITVTYSGYTLDKNTFELELFDSASSIIFNLGGLIEGWQILMPYVKEGGTITMYIPSKYGYGRDGIVGTSIQPVSTLIFTVELHDN